MSYVSVSPTPSINYEHRRVSSHVDDDYSTVQLLQHGVEVQHGEITIREIWGTWRRPFDFTITVIGYVLGIHNFWNFPFLCYKYGGVFFIPYFIMLGVVGIPIVFMEFTLGQFYSMGATDVFGEMAPVLTGVSYLLSWNSLITCWMYTMIIAWLRVYSSDSTSCLKGWQHCSEDHYYNSVYCFTGKYDDECDDVGKSTPNNVAVDQIFFNFECTSVEEFCNIHGWKLADIKKTCMDDNGNIISVYERRVHAAYEYFYGGVCGLETVRQNMIRTKLEEEYKKLNTTRDKATEEQYTVVSKKVLSKENIKMYWTADAEQMLPDKRSSSSLQLKQFSLTTWIVLAVFLYEALLSVSIITYVLNGVPFMILAYLTIKALTFSQAINGIEKLLQGKDFDELKKPNIWAEAVIQVIVTTGIGNGVLISLSTFNKFHHSYLFETFFTILLNFLTSACGAVMVFCTIGHYLEHYHITIDFFEYIKPVSTASSIEFGCIVYTHFLTIISDSESDDAPWAILLFFFMISSFATDTAIRMVQNNLDAVISVFPRLRPHSFLTLLAICIFGFLVLLPMTANGGIAVFMEYEYYVFNYVFPFILFIEVVGVNWIYKASRVLDNAEQMDVLSRKLFRWIIMILLKFIIPIILILTVACSIFGHKQKQFNIVRNEQKAYWTEVCGFLISSTPIILFLLTVLEQYLKNPTSDKKWLCQSVVHKTPKNRRLHIQGMNLGTINLGAMVGIGNLSFHEANSKQVAARAALKWRSNMTKKSWPSESVLQLPSQIPKFSTKNSSPKVTKGRSSHDSTKLSSTHVPQPGRHSKSESTDSSTSSDKENKVKMMLEKIINYFEEWPDRLDDSEIESDSTDTELEEEEEEDELDNIDPNLISLTYLREVLEYSS